MTNTAPSPVDQLRTLGDMDDSLDYLALGITREHVPELIGIATGRDLSVSELTEEEFWAPIHAWRALGVLRAEAAAEPLAQLFANPQLDDDWITEDLPEALGKIGRAAIGPARAVSARGDADRHGRWASMRVLREVAERHPDAREEAVGALIDLLGAWQNQPRDINAFLVSELLDLNAVEAAPVMEAAYQADAVEIEITGDWEDAQEALGLIPKREREVFFPAPPRSNLAPRARVAHEHVAVPPRSAKSQTKSRNRRKDAKAARKRNRRK